MSNYIGQMAIVVDRLLSKTREGKINWSRSSERGLFQTRFDEFLIQITGSRSNDITRGLTSGTFGSSVTLNITGLNGLEINSITSSPTANIFGPQSIPKELASKLQELYNLVSDENELLTRLLKAID